MIELAQLFQDMEAAVVTQEPAIENIEDKTENTVVNLNQGNKHLDGAVVKARSARRKKWICFWIVGRSTYSVPPIGFWAWKSNASSAHCHYHRGRCWGWRWDSDQKMIALSLGAHVPRKIHIAYPSSAFRYSHGLQPHQTLAPGYAAPNWNYGLRKGRFNWLLYYSPPLSFDLTFEAAGPAVDTSLRKKCRIEECGNRTNQNK